MNRAGTFFLNKEGLCLGYEVVTGFYFRPFWMNVMVKSCVYKILCEFDIRIVMLLNIGAFFASDYIVLISVQIACIDFFVHIHAV